MQTTYSQNSIPIDEERLMLFKNASNKKLKYEPENAKKVVKLESDNATKQFKKSNITNELNNKSNTLTQTMPAKPVLNQTAKNTEDISKRIQDDMKRIASENDIKTTIQCSQSSEQSL